MHVALINVTNGSVCIIDTVAKRLERMRQRVYAWATLMSEGQGELWMITLTYDVARTRFSGGRDWLPGDMTGYVRKLRRYLARKGNELLGYAWVAELQKNGHVHYHMLVRVAKSIRGLHSDTLGLWEYGVTNLVKAHSVGYICKYLSKGLEDGQEFPKGLRLFAVWIQDRDRTAAFRVQFWPKWKRDAYNKGFSKADIEEFGKPRSEWLFVGVYLGDRHARVEAEWRLNSEREWWRKQALANQAAGYAGSDSYDGIDQGWLKA